MNLIMRNLIAIWRKPQLGGILRKFSSNLSGTMVSHSYNLMCGGCIILLLVYAYISIYNCLGGLVMCLKKLVDSFFM